MTGAGDHRRALVSGDLHVAHFHADELRPFAGPMSFDNLLFGKRGLAIAAQHYRVISQMFLEKSGIGPQFGLDKLIFERADLRFYRGHRSHYGRDSSSTILCDL